MNINNISNSFVNLLKKPIVKNQSQEVLKQFADKATNKLDNASNDLKTEILIRELDNNDDFADESALAAMAVARDNFSKRVLQYESGIESFNNLINTRDSIQNQIDNGDMSKSLKDKLDKANADIDRFIEVKNITEDNPTLKAITRLVHNASVTDYLQYAPTGFADKYGGLLLISENDSAYFFKVDKDNYASKTSDAIKSLNNRISEINRVMTDYGKDNDMSLEEIDSFVAGIIRKRDQGHMPVNSKTSTMYINKDERTKLIEHLSENGMSEKEIAEILEGKKSLDVYA